VNHGVVVEPVLHLQIDEELVQVVASNVPSRGFLGEEFEEAVQDRAVLAQSVGHLQPFYYVEIVLARKVQESAGCVTVRGRIGWDAERLAFKGAPFVAGDFEGLNDGDTSCVATAFPPLVPLDEVASFRQPLAIGTATAVAGNGNQLPAVAEFDLFENVDVRRGALSSWTV